MYEYWKEVEQNEDRRWMRDNSQRINSKTGVKEKLRGRTSHCIGVLCWNRADVDRLANVKIYET